jgi:hypothetical protein
MTRYAWLLLLVAGAGAAEEHEIGALGGSGFMRSAGVASPHGAASTGLRPGFAVGAVIGHDMYPRLGGEVRYLFRDSNLKLSSGGRKTGFDGVSHLIHYDLLFYPSPKRSRMRAFLAGGAGARVFRGTGKETAFQPLIEFAALTRTQEVKPLVSVGGGVKIDVAPRLRFRAEIRDYLSPFPKQVIAPVGASRISGWLHDLMPVAGISYVF